MKRFAIVFFLAMSASTAVAEEMQGPFVVERAYGAPAPYRDGIHAGIDYGIGTGAPVIAVAKGKVVLIKDFGPDGWEVSVGHKNKVRSIYIHLSKILVDKGQFVNRGQVVGLSGESNSWGKAHYEHLHFGLGKIGVSTENFSGSLDPNPFWLGGKPQCFDPKADYSGYAQNDMTLPLACGEYGKELLQKVGGRTK